MNDTIAEINKTKSWFSKKIKLINHQPDSSRKKKKTQINRIRIEIEEVTTDTEEIQRIMRDYYKKIYANKIDNLEEMDKFLEKHNLMRQNQEETENIKRPITITEIETVIKNLPTKNSPETDGFTGEVHQTFRDELTPILLKLFQKIGRAHG